MLSCSRTHGSTGACCLFVACLVLLAAGSLPAADVPDGTRQTLDAIKQSMDRACRWLAASQNPDGGYGPYAEGRVKNTSDVGITAFVLYAFARSPRGYKAVDGPFISRAVDFLLARQQSDGGFYDPKDPTLQNYRTCVVILALTALDRDKYSPAIRKAQDFVKAQQATEVSGYEESRHLGYGSVGYGDGLRGDLSNSQLAAEALYESGLSGSDELWRRLVVYVSRCQNAETVDPLLKAERIGTDKSGGFRYAPNDTRGPVETLDDGVRLYSPYGSMTYAGLKSFLYARVDRSDPRVAQAFAWVSRNFTVKENPGMATRANPKAGLQGLFYYYHTMAKALSVYGEPVIEDSKGVKHLWAKELADHVLSLQDPQGWWENANERFWENIRALDTAYAVVVLSDCQAFLTRKAAK